MRYGYAILGESLELCKDAADWFAAEKSGWKRARKKELSQ